MYNTTSQPVQTQVAAILIAIVLVLSLAGLNYGLRLGGSTGGGTGSGGGGFGGGNGPDLPTRVSPTPDDKSQQQGALPFELHPVTPQPTPPLTPLFSCGYGPGGPNCDPTVAKTCYDWEKNEMIFSKFQPPTIINANIHIWFTDNHAVVLGYGAISPFSPEKGGPNPADTAGYIQNPLVGDTGQVDTPKERPFFPSLFITDITTNPDSKAGDWEYGGAPIPPTELFGTWKAQGDADPTANYRNVDGVSSVLPPEIFSPYSTEIRWNIQKLTDIKTITYHLTKGSSYRLEFILHDGDGNIAGEKCTNYTVE